MKSQTAKKAYAPGRIAGTSRFLVEHSPERPRSGEGSAARLGSGDVLFIYSSFTGGGGDGDTAHLYGGILDLQSGTINDGRVFFPAPDALNQMSVSLERLQDGDLGIVFIRKLDHRKDVIFFSRSHDDGLTWSEPVTVNASVPDQYMVVNNDRLRQFSSGRLAVPVALYPDGDFQRPSNLGLFYSDDGGREWSLSRRLKIPDENVMPPHRLQQGAEGYWERMRLYSCREQEPGVEELADGRVLFYCRTTLGYMYQAYSQDGGENWSELTAASDIVSPCSPQSIRRLPGSRRLLCLFNDRRHVALGEGPEIARGDADSLWSWRTPLSLAVSDDDGRHWRLLGNIEDETHNYCYTSMLFLDDKLLLTYYESENGIVDGKPVRRNLASLKMQILDIESM